MPKSIDKADVDISKLFDWGNAYSFEYGGNTYTVYVRVVGDADLNRARTYAIRESAVLRKNLRTSGSDDNLAYIPDKDIMTKEEIINATLIGMTRDFTLAAYREVKMNLPTEPNSEASLEEKEEYQKEIDEFPTKREEAITKYVMNRVNEQRKELEKENYDILYNRFVNERVNQLCEEKMVNEFRSMCAYLGTYSDSGYHKKLFTTFEEFNNLPTVIKETFIDFYFSQDMDIDNLKKLPEVTQ